MVFFLAADFLAGAFLVLAAEAFLAGAAFFLAGVAFFLVAVAFCRNGGRTRGKSLVQITRHQATSGYASQVVLTLVVFFLAAVWKREKGRQEEKTNVRNVADTGKRRTQRYVGLHKTARSTIQTQANDVPTFLAGAAFLVAVFFLAGAFFLAAAAFFFLGAGFLAAALNL